MSEALSGISPNDLPDIESDDEDEDDTSQNDGTQEGKYGRIGEGQPIITLVKPVRYHNRTVRFRTP